MSISVFGLMGIPLIKEGDDLVEIIIDAARKQGVKLLNGDVLVVTQKVVSKAEGRIVELDKVKPSAFALEIAGSTGKDPRVVEVVLGESVRVVRMRGHVLIVETRHGHVCANAGVDFSNVEDGFVTLLPVDPDASASVIREGVLEAVGVDVAVVVTDTWGRAWRLGQVDFAIGVAGMSPFRDYRGEVDMLGHVLSVTNVAVADELAAAAELVKGKRDGVPVVVIRGYEFAPGEGFGRDLVRPVEEDLFR